MSMYDEEGNVSGWMTRRLKQAVEFSNQGASSTWSGGRSASFSIKSAGYGFSVSTKSPMSVRRAITALENHKNSGGK